MSEIRTAGELRDFLLGAMEDLRSGKLGTKEAHAISKIAAQINQSIQTEVTAAIQFEKLSKSAEEAGALVVGVAGSDRALPAPADDDFPDEPTPLPVNAELFTGNQPVWCDQCDDMVDKTEAGGCLSKFCPLKLAE